MTGNVRSINYTLSHMWWNQVHSRLAEQQATKIWLVFGGWHQPWSEPNHFEGLPVIGQLSISFWGYYAILQPTSLHLGITSEEQWLEQQERKYMTLSGRYLVAGSQSKWSLWIALS